MREGGRKGWRGRGRERETETAPSIAAVSLPSHAQCVSSDAEGKSEND